MDRARFRVGCDLNYKVAGFSTFIFNVGVVNNSFQRVLNEQFMTEPGYPREESLSPLEEKRHHSFSAAPGTLRVRYEATVELTHHIRNGESVLESTPGTIPPDVVPYLYPSRYCESDKLVRLAQHDFGELRPGFSRVTGVCNWIHDNVEYLRGSTNPLTSAYDTATERAGVCRDFAHLAIAFCRALSIPARFVAGYAYGLQPPDFHAYFEAYLGGAWYIFDATRLAPQTGLIRVGTGRDAADTSFATIFGPATFSSMKITMELVDGSPPDYTTEAISTSVLRES
ncbi:MAG TPA: transglutaminase family protein [Chthoniobacterales bacterium]|jgi:transglutaminase-like putative cysteine protease|nr:transglutaminase family protein [Chthoniobacterales bacterium]